MRSGPLYSKSVVCATAPQAKSAQAAAASVAVDFMVFLIGFSSIAYVLQEPVRRQFAPEPLAPRRLVGRGCHGEKLHALDIAPFRIRDLVSRRAAANLAGDHVAETDVLTSPGYLRRAAALPLLSPAGILRTGNVSQPLVGRAELRPSHGRGRRAQAQRPVEARKRRVIRPPADRYDVHSRLEPRSADDRHGRIGAGCENVRFAIDRARLIAGFAPDAVALRDLGCKALAVRRRRAEHSYSLDSPRLQQRLDMRCRHAARSEHAERAAVFPRHDVRPDGAVGGDSQVLQV